MDQEERKASRPPLGDFYFDNSYIIDALEIRGGDLAEMTLNTLNNGETALDLGSGSGMSTIALANLMPRLTRVTTVDQLVPLQDAVLHDLRARGITVDERKTSIKDYLAEIKDTTHFPVVMARAVRNSGLSQVEYGILAEMIPSKGVLLSLGDTRFPERTLQELGMEIVIKTGIDETVWIRR